MNDLARLKQESLDFVGIAGGAYGLKDPVTVGLVYDLNTDGAACVALFSNKHPLILLMGHPNLSISPSRGG